MGVYLSDARRPSHHSGRESFIKRGPRNDQPVGDTLEQLLKTGLSQFMAVRIVLGSYRAIRNPESAQILFMLLPLPRLLSSSIPPMAVAFGHPV